MAKSKNITSQEPIEKNESVIENVQDDLLVEKDLNKKLTEENAKLIDEINKIKTSWQKDYDLLKSEHDKLQTSYNKLSSLYETVQTQVSVEQPNNNQTKYKYDIGALVVYPTRYQNMRFEVRQHLGEGVNGPLYRLYQYDIDMALSNIAEKDLYYANTFRHE